MTDTKALRAYAALVLDAGLGAGPGTLLRILGEPVQRELMLILAEEAYARGAAHVRLEIDDQRLARIRVDRSPEGNLDDVSEVLRKDAEIFAREKWSQIRIAGYEDAAVMEGVDNARLTRMQRARSRALQTLREAQLASRFPWCVISAPTESWARTVLGPRGTEEQLWKALVPIIRLDAPDPAAALRRHMEGLRTRARLLTERGFRLLHFTGPGTDLRVTLSPASRWLGGGDATPEGKPFMPNIPTEEVYSTPDFRGTEGTVTATRRARIHGAVVEAAHLEFRGGVVVSSSAARGADALARFLETDAGARRLGEVALVDSTSPIWKSGLVFDSMLLDENAACHVALGAGYDMGIDGSEGWDEAEKTRHGLNTSLVHEDFMIGSDDVTVSGVDAAGREAPIITKGRFAAGF